MSAEPWRGKEKRNAGLEKGAAVYGIITSAAMGALLSIGLFLLDQPCKESRFDRLLGQRPNPLSFAPSYCPYLDGYAQNPTTFVALWSTIAGVVAAVIAYFVGHRQG